VGKRPNGNNKIAKKDIRNALDLVWKVFEEFEVPDYSKQGIKEFANFISSAR